MEEDSPPIHNNMAELCSGLIKEKFIKSLYNNTTFGNFGAGSNNAKLHDLSGLSSWTFLNNV